MIQIAPATESEQDRQMREWILSEPQTRPQVTVVVTVPQAPIAIDD
jgi:hypothetical protein